MSFFRQSRRRAFLLCAACMAAFIVMARFFPPPEGARLTVLMYHNLAPEKKDCTTAWTLQPDRLREDLQWLADNGYGTVLPSELSAGRCADGAPLPKKPVMLTFDDGYESNYLYAYPLLREFGAKAAIAPIVSRVGTGGFLTWDECREMESSGLIEFGSHTYDHHIREEANGIERLSWETRTEYERRIGADLDESIAVIRRELGHAPTYFAYPLGKVEPWADSLLASRFRVTVTSKRGRADLRRGLYKLPRYNVSQSEPAEKFF